mmetsp:Transcript_27052/g.47786  ORF Transcript_27052/g.47786 Transcript_27052/m.47786 type:complete len:122 (+) Transcript_27052:3-368(+)
MDTSNHDTPLHICELEVTFPTNIQAEQALQVLQVDKEPSNRVSKSFQLIAKQEENVAEDNGNITTTTTNNGFRDDTTITCLKVRLESKELKMLRVAVSSLYDYLAVVLKTFQEFDASDTTS